MAKNYSTQEQIDKALLFLGKIQLPECPGCKRGVYMCHHVPCIGTPDDMEALINAGHAKSLAIDTWHGRETQEEHMVDALQSGRENPFTEDLPYLVPATVGTEGGQVSFGKKGRCTFLKDNQCSLHTVGLKPVQGQFACCKVERVFIDSNGKQQDLDERIPILHLWNTQRGHDLIQRWKAEVGYTGPEVLKSPTSLGDLMEVLMSVLGKEKSPEQKALSEEVEKEEWPLVTTITMDKPY